MSRGTVLLTGATGFIGRHILADLLAHDYRVRCLVRERSHHRLGDDQRIEPVVGNVLSAAECLRAATGCQAAVHLVGIIRQSAENTFQRVHVEGTRNVIEACRASGVRRLIQMSADQADARSSRPYARTKGQADELVQASELEWTIFRPTLVLGRDGEFLKQMLSLVKPCWKPVPILGDGRYIVQPIGVDEVSRLFVQAIPLEQAKRKIYALGGPRAMTFDEFIDTLSRVACGRQRTKVHIPLALVRPLISILERVLPNPPINRQELAMLLDSRRVPTEQAERDFDWQPLPLEEVLKRSI